MEMMIDPLTQIWEDVDGFMYYADPLQYLHMVDNQERGKNKSAESIKKLAEGSSDRLEINSKYSAVKSRAVVPYNGSTTGSGRSAPAKFMFRPEKKKR